MQEPPPAALTLEAWRALDVAQRIKRIAAVPVTELVELSMGPAEWRQLSVPALKIVAKA